MTEFLKTKEVYMKIKYFGVTCKEYSLVHTILFKTEKTARRFIKLTKNPVGFSDFFISPFFVFRYFVQR